MISCFQCLCESPDTHGDIPDDRIITSQIPMFRIQYTTHLKGRSNEFGKIEK